MYEHLKFKKIFLFNSPETLLFGDGKGFGGEGKGKGRREE